MKKILGIAYLCAFAYCAHGIEKPFLNDIEVSQKPLTSMGSKVTLNPHLTDGNKKVSNQKPSRLSLESPLETSKGTATKRTNDIYLNSRFLKKLSLKAPLSLNPNHQVDPRYLFNLEYLEISTPSNSSQFWDFIKYLNKLPHLKEITTSKELGKSKEYTDSVKLLKKFRGLLPQVKLNVREPSSMSLDKDSLILLEKAKKRKILNNLSFSNLALKILEESSDFLSDFETINDFLKISKIKELTILTTLPYCLKNIKISPDTAKLEILLSPLRLDHARSITMSRGNPSDSYFCTLSWMLNVQLKDHQDFDKIISFKLKENDPIEFPIKPPIQKESLKDLLKKVLPEDSLKEKDLDNLSKGLERFFSSPTSRGTTLMITITSKNYPTIKELTEYLQEQDPSILPHLPEIQSFLETNSKKSV